MPRSEPNPILDKDGKPIRKKPIMRKILLINAENKIIGKVRTNDPTLVPDKSLTHFDITERADADDIMRQYNDYRIVKNGDQLSIEHK